MQNTFPPLDVELRFTKCGLFTELKSGSHLPKKNCVFCLIEKCFLNLKSSFLSQDILVFVTTFWSCRKNGLTRKIRSTSKFMTSQPGLQTIAIGILSNISQSKGNQTMKYGQLIEYNKRNNFLQKLCGKCGKKTSCRPFFIFQKSLI